MPQDWRGVEINIGDTIIYTSPDKEIVEGSVVGFSTAGRVQVKMLYRSREYGTNKLLVHVGADRLTVVSLPPRTTQTRTQAELIEERLLKNIEYSKEWLGKPENTYRRRYFEESIYDSRRALAQLEKDRNA